ncbi:MAG: hypothetical protein K2K23_04860, partial [Muribaculaceae bacterium]|nr:hypothetical protein [Muribaculaceae bacterium]
SAACLAVSASAVEKQAMPLRSVAEGSKPTFEKVEAKHFVKAIDPSSMKKVAKSTRASKPFAFYRPATNIWALGNSVNGYGYSGVTFGLGSSYGDVNFYNFSTGNTSVQWNYSEVVFLGEDEDWDVKTSDAEDLSIKSSIGQMMVPELSAIGESGSEVYFPSNVVGYAFGGSANSWFENDEQTGDWGMSPYQNYGMRDSSNRPFMNTYVSSYSLTERGFNENGVYVDASNNNWNNWQSLLESEYEGSVVSDIVMDNYTLMFPAPASTYSMTRMWGYLFTTSNAETQLISYIYPVGEDGLISETPIALGYAAVPRGENNWVMFEYNPLNEDGDELEGEVYIDSRVAITIEGFSGNGVITDITPCSGFYPVNYEEYSSGNYGILPTPSLCMQFSYNVDGVPATTIAYDRGLYDFDNGDEFLTLASNQMFMVDAIYAYIRAVDGEEYVNVSKEGGEVSLELEAYWYNIAYLIELGYYELSCPEWIKVGLSEVTQQNPYTTMTLSVEPSDTDRTGIVSIEGLGASFSLKVINGEGDAVSTIVIDKTAEKFDHPG